VTIKRGGQVSRQSLSGLVRRQRRVQLAPATWFICHASRGVFMTFGSTPSPGRSAAPTTGASAFRQRTMTLAEALAKSGGLDGLTRANTHRPSMSSRFEPRNIAGCIGLRHLAFTGDVSRPVYSFNWVKPDGLFFADRFQVRDSRPARGVGISLHEILKSST